MKGINKINNHHMIYLVSLKLEEQILMSSNRYLNKIKKIFQIRQQSKLIMKKLQNKLICKE